MGKKKHGFKKAKNPVDSLKNAASSEDEDDIETRLESILDDEIDQYNAFKEKSLMDKGKKAKGRAGKRDAADDSEEEEIYGLNLTSDEEGGEDLKSGELEGSDEDDEDDDDEDILGGQNEEDGLPDSRAWGKKARAYHNTDYVDQDFGGFEGSDAEMAEQEEAEAKEIQKRLTAELDESDFLGLVPMTATNKQKKADKEKEILKVDFDSLTNAEKRKLIQRECPEVIHLLDERKEKLTEAKSVKKESENQSNSFLRDFYVTKYHTIMNYCINISYFLYLRATKPNNCKGHPVVKRILQFRRLLDELNTFNPKKYLKSIQENKKSKKDKRKKPKSNMTSSKMSAIASIDRPFEDQMDLQDSKMQGEDEEEEGAELQEKRAINYTIAKNKGLTPYRKKELRNPRVKHRMKFKKATVRRKGQVRTPRTEVRKYEGELTGIKMNVSKSTKFK